MRARKLSTYSCVLLTLALTCAAQSLPNGVKKVASVEGITEYQLPDGLKVLLFPDPSKPKVTVKVYYQFAPQAMGTWPGRATLEQVKKYASSRPLRRPPPRKGA